MKTKSNNQQKRNLAIPGEPMSEDEFSQLIKEAEKGPFISLEDFKKEVQGWISKTENKQYNLQPNSQNLFSKF